MKKDENTSNNLSNPSKNRPLKRLFFRNYIVISILLLATMVLSLFITDLLMNRYIDRSPDFTQLDSSEIFAYPFENISEQLLDDYGGWFEIVDEWGRVIYVKGEKEDDLFIYSLEELYSKLDVLRNDDAIFYHAFPAVGPDGESYILLWKIPERLENISIAIGILFGSFAVFLLISLYFYTRFSVGQVIKPLQQIIEGMEEMEQFNYQKRLDFTAEKEFAEIRDAFNKMAERLQRTTAEKEMAENNKRNMLLHLSHDLKTPITSILGYSQLLLENQSSEVNQKRKYVQYIHDKSSYMAKLIHDLFLLAKLEDYYQQLNREKVDITEWLRQLVAEFYPEIERKGFQLEVRIPEEPLFVKLDKVHMNRVVTNLISNALTYNPAGTTLSISCQPSLEQVVLTIGDNGIGIEPSFREHVFEQFRQSNKLGQDGSGLGLVICRKIVSLHQGEIQLESDPEYSTLFRIGLPLSNSP